MSSKVRSMEKARTKKGEIVLSLSQLLSSKPALESLIQQPLAARKAFQVARLTDDASRELLSFDKARRSLIERCADISEDGQSFTVRDKDQEVFITEFQSLLDTSVTLKCETLRVSDLADAKMSPAHMSALSWLIVEG